MQATLPLGAASADRQAAGGSSTRRVAAASLAGTTLEFYDHFIYGSAAALVFPKLFFPQSEPLVATLLSFASYGVAFAARPLGAAIFGHFGDKLGRKSILFITLLMMGLATFLIGCLPSFAQVGILAPILLVVLRIIQGLALGGEWGGAAIMVNELDPEGKRRGLLGAVVQVAAPIGLLLANGAFALVTWQVSEEAFLSWGWRVPFLMSAILVGVGLYIRLNVQESKVFEKEAKGHEEHAPIKEVLRHYKPQLAIAFFARLGGDIAFYVFTLFLLYFVPTKLGLPKSDRAQCSADGRGGADRLHPGGRLAVGPHRAPPGADDRRHRRRHLGLRLHADGADGQRRRDHGGFLRRHGAGVLHVLAARLLPARAVRHPGAGDRRLAWLPVRRRVRRRAGPADRHRADRQVRLGHAGRRLPGHRLCADRRGCLRRARDRAHRAQGRRALNAMATAFDTVIRHGLVVTACETMAADIGIRDGRVVALGQGLARGRARDRRQRQAGTARRRRCAIATSTSRWARG